MDKKINRIFDIDKILFPYNREFPSDYRFLGESHMFWEIVFVKRGVIEVTEDENVYYLSEGDIIFHAPMEFHRFKSAEETNPKILNLSFTATGEIPETIMSGVFKLDIIAQKEFEEIFELSKKFINCSDIDIYEGQEIADSLAKFILKICKTSSIKNQLSSSVGAINYRKLVETMNNEVCNNLSLDELARKNYMSVSYVKELFSRYAGISPKKYYTNLRLSKSMQLINEGIMVREISEILNFSSPNYFSEFFKKHTGMTPIEYKNKENS